MKSFTTIGTYGMAFHHKDWDRDVQNLLSEHLGEYLILRQFPFVFALCPGFKTKSASANTFGTVYYWELEHMKTDVQPYCEGCPNALKRLLKDGMCKPCSPPEEYLAASQWKKGALSAAKAALSASGFRYLDRRSFYLDIYPEPGGMTSTRNVLFDIRRVNPEQFHISRSEENGAYYLIASGWKLLGSSFRAEAFRFTARPIGDTGLCYTDYHSASLVHPGIRVESTAFSDKHIRTLLNVLKSTAYPSYTIDEHTPFPYEGVNRCHVNEMDTKKPTYSRNVFFKGGDETLIARIGVLNYYLLANDVYETFSQKSSHTFSVTLTGNPDREDRTFLYRDKLYVRIGTLDELAFSVHPSGEISLGSDTNPSNKSYRTFNELMLHTTEAVNIETCSIYLPALIGRCENFVIGDFARILHPNPHHEPLKNRLGEVLEIDGESLILGFENNYFKETFHRDECNPVLSHRKTLI